MSALDEVVNRLWWTTQEDRKLVMELRKEFETIEKRTEWQPIGTNPTVVGIRYLVFSEGQGISFAYY